MIGIADEECFIGCYVEFLQGEVEDFDAWFFHSDFAGIDSKREIIEEVFLLEVSVECAGWDEGV